jgi:hypothetical protein
MVYYDLNVPWNVTLPSPEAAAKTSKKAKGKGPAQDAAPATKGLELLSASNQANLRACLEMLIHRQSTAVLRVSLILQRAKWTMPSRL